MDLSPGGKKGVNGTEIICRSQVDNGVAILLLAAVVVNGVL